ncbi:MAG: DUF4179 domain-containing protein [Turicibacter sp.]|nr:DUF4179 domain-containing protein [Turicibacter sp.]
MQRLDEVKKQRVIESAVELGMAERVRSSGSWKKQLVAVAAAIVIGLPMFGFAFPSLAQHIPIIRGIFDLVGDSEYHVVEFTRLQDFAQEVAISGEALGMYVTIEEAVFDGQVLYFAYTIESDRELEEHFYFTIRDLGLRVAGVEVHGDRGWGASPGILERISEHTYVTVGSIYFPTFDEPIENAEVHFRLGHWHVVFPIESVGGEMTVLQAATVTYDGFEAAITNAMFSPLSATLHFSFEVAPGYYTYTGWDFFAYPEEAERREANVWFSIRDDLGNVYDRWESASEHDERRGSGWLRMGELHPDATELIVTANMAITHWQLNDWEFRWQNTIGVEEFEAGGGNVEMWDVILGEIVIPIP